MKNRRFFAFLLAVLLILSLFAGCGKKPSSAPNADAMKPGSDALVGEGVSGGESASSHQKLIRNVSMQAETEDLDALLKVMEARLKELGGYVEKKEVYRGSANAQQGSRSASLTLRIPAEKADAFVEKVGEAANITSTTEDVKDVTLQYVATESRIAALETEQARLLELLSKAATMNDLLLIESRLTEVQTELEEVTSQLRLYDNLVDYATVQLRVQEVREYTQPEEEGFWQRIGSGLSRNFKNLGVFLSNLLVFLITSVPYFLVIGAIIALILLGRKLYKKRR